MRALLLAVTLVLGLPAAAHADRWIGDEGVGDARAWQFNPDNLCEATEVISEATAAQDITALVVRHQPRKLVLRLRYAATGDLTNRTAWFHVRTPRRELAVDLIQRDNGRWWLDVGPEMRWHPDSLDTDGDGVGDCEAWTAVGSFWRCRDHEIEIGPRYLLLALSRTCLRDPAWVEVGAESWAEAGDLTFHDEWGTSAPSFDPNIRFYGERVDVSPGRRVQKASPSNRSRVTNSETSWRRSFVISRTGLPSGTTAATAY